MKWLTTILAFYLLALSLWPCADEAMTVRAAATSMVTALHVALPNSHPHEHDQCTPFCTCSCCAATITVVPHFSYSLAPSVRMVPPATDGFSYDLVYWVEPLAAIWQPPQRRV